ncbi:MAG TPA: hypothetical protein PK079_23955 [Leptospiraceae bacterium]|nr:hypothetical protein [Leptospiraceae bacterium]HMW08556.1 hypothetical protein [Leptospiraceae bacterium]HMZ66501.1 hypothetical protein [Leptospiraceae bacterium]HNA10043.1 hypothetical protein [Leptospiraceae bacterium]HNC00440.1 hypothetical protein [Leptospiraceae bacterium]
MKDPNYLASYIARYQRRMNRIYRWQLFYEIAFHTISILFIWIVCLLILEQAGINQGVLI